MQKLSQVKVKRKGQVTIPKEIRNKLGIEVGTTLYLTSEDNKIKLKPAPRLEAGEPVGEEEFRKIIAELDQSRRNMRCPG